MPWRIGVFLSYTSHQKFCVFHRRQEWLHLVHTQSDIQEFLSIQTHYYNLYVIENSVKHRGKDLHVSLRLLNSDDSYFGVWANLLLSPFIIFFISWPCLLRYGLSPEEVKNNQHKSQSKPNHLGSGKKCTGKPLSKMSDRVIWQEATFVKKFK